MELAQQAGRDFAGTTYTAELSLDLSELYQDVELAKRAIAGIDGTKVKIGADTDDLDRDVKNSAAEVTKLSNADAKITITGEPAKWHTSWKAAHQEAKDLNDFLVEIGIIGEDGKWKGTTKEVRAEIDRLKKQHAEIGITGDPSDWDRDARETTADVERLDKLEAEIDIHGQTEDWDDANDAVDRDIAAWETRNPQVDVGMDKTKFDTKKKAVDRDTSALGRMKPQVILAMISDPFNTTLGAAMRNLRSSIKGPHKVEVKTNFVEAAQQANIFSRGIHRVGNGMTSVGTTLTGKDGSLQRKLVGFVSAIAGLGGAATKAASGLATAAGGMAEAGAAAGGAGGKMGGLASSTAMAGGSAFVSATAFGVLLAAIVPLMAILATGVATIAAVAAGFALIGAAGVQLAKDFGTVSAANNRVKDAQYALNEAQKAGEKQAKELLPLQKKMEEAEKSEKSAKDRLSAAWDKLNAARNPADAKAVASAERGIDSAQKAQDGATKRLDSAWTKLNAARDSKNTSAIKAAEKELASAQSAEEKTTTALDTAFAKLDKTRSPQKANAVANAEKEVAAAEKDVETKTAAVESATKKLEEARKGASGMRILEAERELGRAQNEQAVALKKAAGGSAEYAKALDRVHTEAELLGPAFRKAFTPAAAQLGNVTADVLALARKHMPLLGKTSEDATAQIRDGFNKGHSSSSTFKDVLDDLPGIMGDIGGTTKNLKSTWTSFMDVALPYVKDFTQWVEDASRRLAEWADSEEGRKKIAEFLDMAVPIAKSLGNMLKTVGGHLYTIGKEHGPEVVTVIEGLTDAIGWFIDALGTAVDLAAKLYEWWKKIRDVKMGGNSKENYVSGAGFIPPGSGGGGGGGGSGGGGSQSPHGRAFGGDTLYTAAYGLSEAGAHFVNGPKMGQVGETSVLYGEALSGDNREYAFPLGDGSMRFITEEPGYDGNSYSLWRDLGQRKGYFSNNTGPAPKAPSVSAGASRPQARGSSTATLESALDRQTDALLGAAQAQREATENVGPSVRDGVNHNNEHSRGGRTSVQKGLSRDATKLVFEGRL